MQPNSPHDLALKTVDEFFANLQAHFRKEVFSHRNDPRQLRKKETDICRLRVLPVNKTPVRFWSSQWCFYEIGIGHYSALHGEGLNLGGISFVQFPFNERCGKGRYLRPVIDVLRQLEAERPTEFRLSEARNEKEATIFHRRYFVSSFPTFPTSVAANDLAWLVQKSLPQFQAISL